MHGRATNVRYGRPVEDAGTTHIGDNRRRGLGAVRPNSSYGDSIRVLAARGRDSLWSS